jgi:hypothetical protein
MKPVFSTPKDLALYVSIVPTVVGATVRSFAQSTSLRIAAVSWIAGLAFLWRSTIALLLILYDRVATFWSPFDDFLRRFKAKQLGVVVLVFYQRPSYDIRIHDSGNRFDAAWRKFVVVHTPAV